MRQGVIYDHHELFAVRHAAVMFATGDFGGVHGQIPASDFVMNAKFSATDVLT